LAESTARAETALAQEINNKHNKAIGTSVLLLAHTYIKTGNRYGYNALLAEKGKTLSHTIKQQIPAWPGSGEG